MSILPSNQSSTAGVAKSAETNQSVERTKKERSLGPTCRNGIVTLIEIRLNLWLVLEPKPLKGKSRPQARRHDLAVNAINVTMHSEGLLVFQRIRYEMRCRTIVIFIRNVVDAGKHFLFGNVHFLRWAENIPCER